MKDSYLNIGEVFETDFPETTIENSTVEFEKGRAHCIFVKIPNEKFLHENWKGITNSIAFRTESVDFSYDPNIYDVLKDKIIKKKNILPEQLNLAYDELITIFRKEEE